MARNIHANNSLRKTIVVLAEELGSPSSSEPLHWVLLTTEAVSSAEDAMRFVRYDELRWRIDDYHKAWKDNVFSG